MAFDIKIYRELLRKAIGDRSQREFARVAGLSCYNLNRMLNKDDNGVPTVRSLEKIAEASQGRVTLGQLKAACGYSPDERTAEGPAFSGREGCIAVGMRLKEGLDAMCGSAQRYGDIDTLLSAAGLASGIRDARYYSYEPRPYKGTGRMGVGSMAFAKYMWRTDEYEAELYFTLFFHETKDGGFVFAPCAFDLNSLMELGHPGAQAFVNRQSAKGDLCFADYPVVISAEKNLYDPKERLFNAIFGAGLL